MRKAITTLLIVSFLILSGFGALSIHNESSEQIETLSIKFSTPIIDERNDDVLIELIDSTSSLNQPGNPMLPIISQVFIFPFGTKINDVSVEFSDYENIQLLKDIVPANEPLYINNELNQKINVPIKNEQIYNSNNIYPVKPYWIRTGAGLQGEEHVVFCTIFMSPISYRPLSKQIQVSSNAEISISYELPNEPVVFADDYDLLIITPNMFMSNAQPLVEAKQSKGVNTKLISLEEIPQVGLDRQEDIKYYIKDAIENWGITYVILIGGGLKDSEDIIPVRYAWVPSGNYEKKFPSDLYYADVYNADGSFSTWDNDSDQKYAEYPTDNDACDLYPDVYLSRLPCLTASDVTNVVNKIINFMDTNQLTNNIVQIGGDTFPGDPQSINEGEYANAEVLDKLSGYSSSQYWGSKNNMKRWRIILGILRGCDYVDFSGHGNALSWSTHPPEDDSRWIPEGFYYNGFTYIDVEWLFNSWKLPVVVLNACSNSKFTEFDPCLSWAFVKKKSGGGIASFGASGIGYGSYGSSETERLFGWMEVHLFEGMYNDEILGLVWGNCLNEYINSFNLEDADYKTIYEMALFGDPSLSIGNAS
jgi:hypothetical protein